MSLHVVLDLIKLLSFHREVARIYVSPVRLCTVGLQSTRLGMHIEDRVNKYLKRQNHPEAGEVFVRVVASSDKTVEVKPGMKAR